MVSTKASIRRRYDALRARAQDTKSPANERAQASAAADKIAREHPWVEKPDSGKPPPPPKESSPPPWTPPPLRGNLTGIADVLLRGAKATATAWVADRIDHAARSADHVIDSTLERLTGMSVHPDRMSNADLVNQVEVSGAILPVDEDENEVVAVVLLVNVDVANAIADRSDEGARKLEGMLGRSVVAAIDTTLEHGECGEWPFGDDDEV